MPLQRLQHSGGVDDRDRVRLAELGTLRGGGSISRRHADADTICLATVLSPSAMRTSLSRSPGDRRSVGIVRQDGRGGEWGLTALRVAAGVLMVGHGMHKLHDVDGTGRAFDHLGLRPGRHHTLLAGVTEAGAGAASVLGVFTPAASAALTGTMTVAIAKVHGKNGPWITKGGYEYNATLIAVGLRARRGRSRSARARRHARTSARRLRLGGRGARPRCGHRGSRDRHGPTPRPARRRRVIAQSSLSTAMPIWRPRFSAL